MGAHSHVTVFKQRLRRLECCFHFSWAATGRRSAPPLNLTGLPGTEKLNEREKEVQLGGFSLFFSHVFRTSPPVAGLNDTSGAEPIVLAAKR